MMVYFEMFVFLVLVWNAVHWMYFAWKDDHEKQVEYGLLTLFMGIALQGS